MALNAWWIGVPRQCYWLEITDREEVGDDLYAPHDGHYAHELVSAPLLGDRVLHWVTNRGLVGWSEVAVAPKLQSSKTGSHSESDPPITGDENWWVVGLSGLQTFDAVVGPQKLHLRRDKVLNLLKDVSTEHRGPIYLPFNKHGGGIRARQGYFATWPFQLFDLFPEVSAAIIGSAYVDEVPEEDMPEGQSVRVGVTTRVQDPELRKALEVHAVARAREYYDSLQATDFVELGKPYDLKLTLDGVERHVEVKGSSALIAAVELTRNEVSHARSYGSTDLVVVDGIRWNRDGAGTVTTAGGRVRVWSDWSPLDEHLSPRKFCYDLPPDSEEV